MPIATQSPEHQELIPWERVSVQPAVALRARPLARRSVGRLELPWAWRQAQWLAGLLARVRPKRSTRRWKTLTGATTIHRSHGSREIIHTTIINPRSAAGMKAT